MKKELPKSTRKMMLGIEVEGEIYTSNVVKKMSSNEVKMLVSFCENIKDVKTICKWQGSYEMDLYAENLETKITGL